MGQRMKLQKLGHMGQDGAEPEILKSCSLDLSGKLWKALKGFKGETWAEQIDHEWWTIVAGWHMNGEIDGK